jgi:hypothetical protein
MQAVNAVTLDELLKALEPVMRRVIREELDLITKRLGGIFHLETDSDLYKDMLELQERNAAGQLRFLSHKEVWGAGKEETYGSAD